MTYFPDLSPYTYTPYDTQAGFITLNIGWLEPTEHHTTGVTSLDFQTRLLTFCSHDATVNHCLGYHFCPFCTNRDDIVRINWEDKEIFLGSGEIRAIGSSVLYAAPTLIYHYIVVHNYQPPAEFIDAVQFGPGPDTPEHQTLLRKLVEAAEMHRAPEPSESELLARRAQEDALFGITPSVQQDG
jgi:hypothetical protein